MHRTCRQMHFLFLSVTESDVKGHRRRRCPFSLFRTGGGRRQKISAGTGKTPFQNADVNRRYEYDSV